MGAHNVRALHNRGAKALSLQNREIGHLEKIIDSRPRYSQLRAMSRYHDLNTCCADGHHVVAHLDVTDDAAVVVSDYAPTN